MTEQKQIPWSALSVAELDLYLAVSIDDRVATEPKAMYVDRLKELVGEDIPIVVSFGHVTLTSKVS